MQELKFHLQDVHCIELRRGVKQFSSGTQADRPCKVKSLIDSDKPILEFLSGAGPKYEYKFVDETAKLWSQDIFRAQTISSNSSRSSISSPDWKADSTQRGSETPPSLICSVELGKTGPRLFAGAAHPSVKPSNCDIVKAVDLTGLDSEMTHLLDFESSLQNSATTQSTSLGK